MCVCVWGGGGERHTMPSTTDTICTLQYSAHCDTLLLREDDPF